MSQPTNGKTCETKEMRNKCKMGWMGGWSGWSGCWVGYTGAAGGGGMGGVWGVSCVFHFEHVWSSDVRSPNACNFGQQISSKPSKVIQESIKHAKNHGIIIRNAFTVTSCFKTDKLELEEQQNNWQSSKRKCWAPKADWTNHTIVSPSSVSDQYLPEKYMDIVLDGIEWHWMELEHVGWY